MNKVDARRLVRIIPMFLAILLSIAVLCFTSASEAQNERRKLPPPGGQELTLDGLLDHLEAAILNYRQSVPNLYCTETAQADRSSGGKSTGPNIATPGGEIPAERTPGVEIKSKNESTFRLRRTTKIGDLGAFEETRIPQRVDGKPVTSDTKIVPAPAILYGVFSNGLNILSKEGRACFSFRLRSIRKNKPIMIDFSDLPKNERAQDCPPFEGTSGYISVEPTTMHVIHIEKKTPKTELSPGVFGFWEWTEDYSPVKLINKEFWMPYRIRSRSTATDGADLIWNFDARYTDYHLFHAESRIVPLEP